MTGKDNWRFGNFDGDEVEGLRVSRSDLAQQAYSGLRSDETLVI